MPIREFTTHPLRRVLSLEGLWKYHFPKHGNQIDPLDRLENTQTHLLHVPGVWETLPPLVEYRGQSIALRRIRIEQPGPLILLFEGVSHTCRVFFDGIEIGSHHNAYTPFSCLVPDALPGWHEIRLWITNEHGPLSALHVPNDYYNYGGISRPAELHHLPTPAHISSVRFTPRKNHQTWKALIQATITLTAKNTENLSLSVSVAGIQISHPLPTNDSHKKEIETSFEFDLPATVATWSPESPTLHLLEATLSQANTSIDTLCDRVGIREIQVQGRHILLNGKPLRIHGINRHEDHPDFGCALPVELMQRDLALCRQLGVNLIRTSHYPNDHRFLDLCDEMGFLVWEESHARGLFDERSAHPLYLEQTVQNTREMILAHHNHPSIILWGYLNECDTWTPHGCATLKAADQTIRSLDPSRPTTYAACHWERDLCQNIPDVLSWNIYPLWYKDISPSEMLNNLEALLESKGVNNKPLIISEFGAGAIFGFRDAFRKAKLSEERQRDILDTQIRAWKASDRHIGFIIWQFCDVRVDPSWANERARQFNEKGLVDEYRRPKLAFEIVQAHLHNLNQSTKKDLNTN